MWPYPMLAIMFRPFGFSWSEKTIRLCDFPIFEIISVRSNLDIYVYSWSDTSAGGLLVPKGVIRPAVSASALTWFNRYMYY